MIHAVLSRFPREETYLIEILRAIMDAHPSHVITEAHMKEVASYLNITQSKVSSTVSFYSLLSDTPKGKYVIQVCRDVPCFVSDSTSIVSTLESLLAIKIGQTTYDGLFTLEFVSCLGCCDHAPAMRINSTTYSDLTPTKVKAIIHGLREAKP